MRAHVNLLRPGALPAAVRRAVVLLALVAVCGLAVWPQDRTALAASAYSPRRSGLEPPGGPRPMETLPASNAGRTAEGGMGHTDAYGNTVEDRPQQEKPARQRPRPGAYGGGAAPQAERPLPDPLADQTPAWNFK